MLTSTSAWSRSRWISSSTDERIGSWFLMTAWRKRSIDCSGARRAVMTRSCATLAHMVEMSDASNEKLCTTSLTTAIRVFSACSMRVEREPWCRVS